MRSSRQAKKARSGSARNRTCYRRPAFQVASSPGYDAKSRRPWTAGLRYSLSSPVQVRGDKETGKKSTPAFQLRDRIRHRSDSRKRRGPRHSLRAFYVRRLEYSMAHPIPSRALRSKLAREPKDNPAEIAESFVSRICEDIERGTCVMFVGAGCTTERGQRHTATFYQEIREKACYPADTAPPSFPVLMQYFCDHVDGGHHNRLITEAISRIERFCDHGEEERCAKWFCDPIAEVPYLNRFVTTNWDPFLERSLDVLVAIVEDRDLAFWDDSKRQVLKIHGCVTRPYTIVATQSDYDACMERNPLIFNKLRDLMATKTFIFVGYSMRDPDFQEVWKGITGTLGHFARLAYAVDIDATPETVSSWKARGIELVKTSDVLFVRALRERLEKKDLIPSQKFLTSLHCARRQIASTHLRMGQESVGKLASAMYQDGLLHALDYVLLSTALGVKTKENFESELNQQNQMLEDVLDKPDPIEIAYRSGWVEVLEAYCNRSTSPIKRFFHPYRGYPIKHLVRGEKIGGYRVTPTGAERSPAIRVKKAPTNVKAAVVCAACHPSRHTKG